MFSFKLCGIFKNIGTLIKVLKRKHIHTILICSTGPASTYPERATTTPKQLLRVCLTFTQWGQNLSKVQFFQIPIHPFLIHTLCYNQTSDRFNLERNGNYKMSGEILVVQNFTDYGRPMFSINQALFLQKNRPLYPNPKYCDLNLNLNIKELGI